MNTETIRTKYPDSFTGIVRKSLRKNRHTGMISVLCLTLIAITVTVYLQAGNHQFLNFDDDIYVTENPHVARGITAPNIIWAFSSVEAGNWHPITWLSHMADVRFFGMNPRGHHLINVALHTLSALILFFLLLRLTAARWQSWFVAAMFALHPLHVESVAWVAERKDLLCGFFWFLTLLLYAGYAAKQKPVLYLLTLSSFVLGLMSKPMLVTLPVVMLLLDLCPLGRYRHEVREGVRQRLGRLTFLVKEKIPFFACSLLSGLITIYAQREGGAIHGLKEIPLWLRIENALNAYAAYLGKTLWPHDLAVFYPFPPSIPIWQVIGSLVILLLISAAAVQTAHRHPYFAVGWFWYIITLVPVIGLIQVGGQSMADRYSYIPVTGLFIMVAWGVPDLTKGIRHRQSILALSACAALFASAALTWQQLGYWRDNISLYRHTLRVTTSNPGINYNLGLALHAQGEPDAAIRQFQEALKINPDDTRARNAMGVVLHAKWELDAAIKEFRQVLLINPRHIKAHYNLGLIFQIKGNPDEAIKEYQEVLRLDPDYAHVDIKLAQALSLKRMQDENRK